MIAVTWLTDFFDTNGEPQPGKREIAYDQCNINDLYKEYKTCPTVLDLTTQLVSYAQFTKLMRTVFPECKQRPYKSITGKCITCEKLRNASRTAT